jgi:hypothetical protein
MDSKTLAHFPASNLLLPTLLIYSLGRFILLKKKQQKISLLKVIIPLFFFLFIASYLGMYISLFFFSVIFILWDFVEVYRNKNSPFVGFELGWVITLIASLGVLFALGQLKKTDEEWLLGHLALRGAEINYQRLLDMPKVKGLCNGIQNIKDRGSRHFRKAEYLSKLAIKQKDCHKELHEAFQKTEDPWLYIALVDVIAPSDPLSKELCSYKNPLKDKLDIEIEKNDMKRTQDKVRSICSKNPIKE